MNDNEMNNNNNHFIKSKTFVYTFGKKKQKTNNARNQNII